MEIEEYEGTVISRTLLFYNSVFLGRREKNISEFIPNFFRRFIERCCSIILFSPIFLIFAIFVL